MKDSPTEDAYIQVEGVCKSFGPIAIFQDFNIEFPQYKIAAIFGSNGCGKSTLINLMSGLIPCDRGRITIAGKPLHRARIGCVFQNYQASLFPWLSAWDNIRYPLKIQKIPKREQRSRIEHLIATCDIKLDWHRYPYQFSGGQQQLIAILRAAIATPDVLFLDEPFSSLDLEMTLYMRDKLQQICSDFALTTVMVSHDLDDAIYLADRAILLGERPTQILDRIPINLPRPRIPEMLADAEFVRVKGYCLKQFRAVLKTKPTLTPNGV
jgi:NitT/TauT family transport system ATP-binding protein